MQRGRTEARQRNPFAVELGNVTKHTANEFATHEVMLRTESNTFQTSPFEILSISYTLHTNGEICPQRPMAVFYFLGLTVTAHDAAPPGFQNAIRQPGKAVVIRVLSATVHEIVL